MEVVFLKFEIKADFQIKAFSYIFLLMLRLMSIRQGSLWLLTSGA